MNREIYAFMNGARVLHLQWLKLRAKRNELELCLMPKAIRYDLDKVQSSPADGTNQIVIEILELERQMAEIQHNKYIQIEKIDAAINELESDEERTALTMRFINRASVAEIAAAMGYAEPTIYKFMNQGADKIQKSIRNINSNVK